MMWICSENIVRVSMIPTTSLAHVTDIEREALTLYLMNYFSENITFNDILTKFGTSEVQLKSIIVICNYNYVIK